MALSHCVLLFGMVPAVTSLYSFEVQNFRTSIGMFANAISEDRHALSLAVQANATNRRSKPMKRSEGGDVQLVDISPLGSTGKADVGMDAAGTIYTLGQRILCRGDASRNNVWRKGTATSVSPLMCKPDGWTQGYSFKEVQPVDATSQKESRNTPHNHWSSSALQVSSDDRAADDDVEWPECDITAIKTGDDAGNKNVINTVDQLKKCTKRLQEEATLTMQAHQMSQQANTEYITKFKEAISLMAQLSDVQELEKAFEKDHLKVRHFLKGKAELLTNGLNKLVTYVDSGTGDSATASENSHASEESDENENGKVDAAKDKAEAETKETAEANGSEAEATTDTSTSNETKAPVKAQDAAAETKEEKVEAQTEAGATEKHVDAETKE